MCHEWATLEGPCFDNIPHIKRLMALALASRRYFWLRSKYQRQSEATTWYFDFKLIQFWASGRRNCGLSSTCLCLRFATVLKGQMSCEDVKKVCLLCLFLHRFDFIRVLSIWFQARMLRGVLRTVWEKTNDQISEFPHWSGLGDVKTSLCKWGRHITKVSFS